MRQKCAALRYQRAPRLDYDVVAQTHVEIVHYSVNKGLEVWYGVSVGVVIVYAEAAARVYDFEIMTV